MNAPPAANSVAKTGPRCFGPAVTFDDVRLTLNGTTLLDGASLRVRAGEVHALIGPNGAGKTSLLRCLLGQLPHAGKVALNWPGERAGRVGYVPQTLDFDRHSPVTVEDFLGVMAQRWPVFFGLRASTRANVASDLARVGLVARRRARLGTLSGGELKRLLLAQALRPRPDLLILDEPMNHLDAAGVTLAMDLLRELRQAGATVVVTLHELAHARALADTVTGMAAGRVVFSGAPAEVLTPEAVLALYTHGGLPTEGAA
jgi:zinc transport system ATP-binding protein